jgi:scorpion calcine family protein
MMKKYVVFLLLAAVCVGSTAQRPKKRRPAKKAKTVRVEKQTERFVTEPAYRTSKVTVNKTTNGEVRNLTSAELRQQMINKEKRLGKATPSCDGTKPCSQKGNQTTCKKEAGSCDGNKAGDCCKEKSGDCKQKCGDAKQKCGDCKENLNGCKQNSEACGAQKNCRRQGTAQGECRSSENCSQQSGVKLSAEKGWISRLDFRVKNLQELREKTDFIIVVDGKEITDNAALAAIKSSDIASVQLLQGEDATAKYGERGKKGVLLLKTRQVEANVKAESDCSKQ